MDDLIAAQEEYYGKSIIVADREMVESQSDDILAGAKDEDVSFLVVGDPFGWASLAILSSQPCAAQDDIGTMLSLHAGCMRTSASISVSSPEVLVTLHRATTHTDLELRARDLGIPVKIIHNASIMNAVGVCGLQLYRFGEVGQPHVCSLAAVCLHH